MSRKQTIFTEPYEAPTVAEVLEAIERVGGKSEASRLLKKNWSTVDRWCKGINTIDYANWLLLTSK
jgi:hypothetical protein